MALANLNIQSSRIRYFEDAVIYGEADGPGLPSVARHRQGQHVRKGTAAGKTIALFPDDPDSQD